MGELILTIPNTHAGNVAIEHLRSSQAERELGCVYRESLIEGLRDLNAGRYLELLPFTFHLVRVEDGRELAAMNRISHWHPGERADFPYGRVESVEFNFPLYPLAALGLPFHLGGDHSPYLTQMRVHEAHRIAVKGAGIHVVILDTGLDAAAAPRAQDFFDVENTQNLHPVPPAPIDNDGHGTAMAELIHAVAPEAEIWVVRVLDTGSLNLWNLLAGIGIAVADCEADIVNLSLGFSSLVQKCPGCGAPIAVRSIAFEKLTDTATPGTAKVPIYVAATGNSSSVSGFDFPASSEKCVAVGSVDSSRQRSSFSNFGMSHNAYLMAPGGQETSPGYFAEHVGTGGGNNLCAGSSVAAAYTSGILALLRSEARYAMLGRKSFIDTILANHCVLPSHAQNKPTEYGSGIVEYSLPATSSSAPDPSGTTAQKIWTDGDYVYIGGVRLKINKRY